MKSRGSFTLFLMISLKDASSELNQVTLQINSPIYFTKKAMVTSLLRISSNMHGQLIKQNRGVFTLMKGISRDSLKEQYLPQILR